MSFKSHHSFVYFQPTQPTSFLVFSPTFREYLLVGHGLHFKIGWLSNYRQHWLTCLSNTFVLVSTFCQNCWYVEINTNISHNKISCVSFPSSKMQNVSNCHGFIDYSCFNVPHKFVVISCSVLNANFRIFPFLVLKIDLHLQLYFHHFYCIQPCAIMAQLGEKLQNEIEPIIRDFIDCMEPGTPRVEIESYCREDSCQVFIHFKKSLSEKHSLFKTGFKISSESDVRYL